MKDTSLENTLFQLEFNTDRTLQGVFDFLKCRFSIQDLLDRVNYTDYEVTVYFSQKARLSYFTGDELAEAMLNTGGLETPKRVIGTLIDMYGVLANELFDENTIREDFNELFESPCLECVSDDALLRELELRSLTTQA